MSKELWKIQQDFNDKFWASRGGYPETEEALTAATKDYALHLIKEVTEVLDEISFKMHRVKKTGVDSMNVLEELIDTQKFLWGMFQLWKFDYEAFENEFRRKSTVVEQRWAQEQSLPQLASSPCVLIDIDGVLANWDDGFYLWLSGHNEGHGTPYQAKQWYAKASLQEQEEIKREFRQSGAKANLEVLPGARGLLQTIRDNSLLKIILLTSRPYSEHYRIYPDTLEWLTKNKLPYDAIIWTSDKGLEAVKQFKNIAWALDDKTKNVVRLREAGITTVQLNPNDPNRDTHAFLTYMQRGLARGLTIENAGYSPWKKEGAIA